MAPEFSPQPHWGYHPPSHLKGGGQTGGEQRGEQEPEWTCRQRTSAQPLLALKGQALKKGQALMQGMVLKERGPMMMMMMQSTDAALGGLQGPVGGA